MSLLQVVDRKNEIRLTAAPTAVIKQRIATAAQELSRVGDMAARVEIANEALCKFTAVLYERDGDGVPANIDAVTYRLLVPAPWGSAGWRAWGLRKWEAGVLRSILIARVKDTKRPCLYDYNHESRTWHLNAYDYGNLEAAQHYLNRGAITLAEWRKCSKSYASN